ncbi:hypothetical protein ACFFTN_10535 [Aminobacter aganoensis]|uniref:Uncharacterized protein n=1 Tax=Aminobacter aganoensis TaxID=83264 RepID=A0A7X0KNI6_9HYPH|nr:hypothetical protein [Aminobacter aganoensis]MBB6357207.1 hypothetical protein [Aminobacter aganoensis]
MRKPGPPFWLSPSEGRELHRLGAEAECLARKEQQSRYRPGKRKALIDSSHDAVSSLSADQTTPIAISIDQV